MTGYISDYTLVRASDLADKSGDFSYDATYARSDDTSLKYDGTTDDIVVVYNNDYSDDDGKISLWVYSGTAPAGGDYVRAGPCALILDEGANLDLAIAGCFYRDASSMEAQLVSMYSNGASIIAQVTEDISSLSDSTWYQFVLEFHESGGAYYVDLKVRAEHDGDDLFYLNYNTDAAVRGELQGMLFQMENTPAYVDDLLIYWNRDTG